MTDNTETLQEISEMLIEEKPKVATKQSEQKSEPSKVKLYNKLREDVFIDYNNETLQEVSEMPIEEKPKVATKQSEQKPEPSKVKLYNKLREDVFIDYNNEKIMIPAQGNIEVIENDTLVIVPGVVKINI